MFFLRSTITPCFLFQILTCVFVQVFARIRTLVTKPDALQFGVSASDAARTLGIAPAMAKEHLLTAESKGIFLRCSLEERPFTSMNFS